MSEIGDVTATLLGHLVKIVKGMSDEDVKRVASGESKLVLLRPRERVLDYTPVVDQTLKALQKLSAEELQQLEDRRGRVAFLRKDDKVVSPLDPREVAARVSELRTEDEIVRFLDADSRLTAPKLKLIAAELDIEVPSTVKSKPALQLHIAQRSVHDRGRWSWR